MAIFKMADQPLMKRFSRWFVMPLFLLLTITVVPASAQIRYEAVFQDGKSITGTRLERMLNGTAKPQLDGRQLLDAKNFARVVQVVDYKIAQPDKYIVFTNGDILPIQEIVGFTRTPVAALIVKPAQILHPAKPPNRNRIYVRYSWIRSIVLKHTNSTKAAAGVVVTSKGEQLAVKSLRFSSTGVRGLTSKGLLSLKYTELRELHLPKPAIMENLLLECSRAQWLDAKWLMRVKTANGAICTSPRSLIKDQMRTSHEGRNVELAMFSPHWSLNPVVFRTDRVVVFSLREVDEIPLSQLPVVKSESEAVIAHLPWQKDRNVLKGPLRTKALFSDQGLGTHSKSTLTFSLPQGSIAFRSWIGLDDSAGNGGCVKCSVLQDSTSGKKLYTSDYLQGQGVPQLIKVALDKNAKQLVLVTDFAHKGRPKNADPWDIRDLTNWLSPLVKVKIENQKPIAAGDYIACLSGWQINNARNDLRLAAHWKNGQKYWIFGFGSVRHQTVQLTRTLEIDSDHVPLHLRVSGQQGNPRVHEVKLIIDDKQDGSLKTRGNSDQNIDYKWNLAKHAGSKINLKIDIEIFDAKKNRPKDKDRITNIFWYDTTPKLTQ